MPHGKVDSSQWLILWEVDPALECQLVFEDHLLRRKTGVNSNSIQEADEFHLFVVLREDRSILDGAWKLEDGETRSCAGRLIIGCIDFGFAPNLKISLLHQFLFVCIGQLWLELAGHRDETNIAHRRQELLQVFRLGAVLDRDDGSYNLTVQEDVLLGDRAHDAARVIALLTRVAEQADRLEQIHLPDADRILEVFAADLRQEGLGHHD